MTIRDAALEPDRRPAVLSPSFAKLFFGLLFCILNLNLFALVPYYLELRGQSELFYGVAAGTMGLGGVIAMVLLGGHADRTSRRRAVLRYMAASCAGNLLALAAMDRDPSFYLLAIGLHGVMAGVGLPVIFVWASELSPPDRRTEALAWLGIAGLSGDSLGPLLGELLLSTRPDPHAPEAFGIVFLAANVLWPIAVLFFLWTPNVPGPAGSESGDARLLPLFRLPEIRLALIGTVAFGGALGLMTSLGKNFVVSIGLEFVSVLLTGHTVGAVLSRLALPWVLARIERRRLVMLSYVGIALSMTLLTVTTGYGLLAVAGLCYGASHGLLFPTLFSRLIDFAGTRAAGRVSTLYMGMFGLGMGLLPAAGGAVLHVAGFSTLFFVAAVACLGAIVLQGRAERRYAERVGSLGKTLDGARTDENRH